MPARFDSTLAATGAFGPRPTNVRWRIFGLSCAASWTLYLHRYTFALITPALATQWNVEPTDLGYLPSVFYATYVALQVPCGILVDRLGTHLFLGGIIVAWSAFLALHAWAPSAGAMYWIRIGFGATQAGCYPALGKVTQTWFPFSIRTSLQAWIASFSGRFGGASANLLFATVMLGYFGLDWRTSIYILSIWGLFLGVAVLIVFRNSPSDHPRVNQAECALIEYRPVENAYAAVQVDEASPSISSASSQGNSPHHWSRRISRRSAINLAFFLLQYFGATFADTIYVVWMPTVLKTQHGVTDQQMGFYSSLPLIGGALGGLMGGYLNDLLIRVIGRRWTRSLVGCGGNLGACCLVLVALKFFNDPLLFCSVLLGAKIFSDWCQPTTWGTVTDFSGRHAATIFGLGNGVGGLGAVLAPPVFASVAVASSWHAVFALVAATYLASSACWLAVNCTITVLDDHPTGGEVAR